MSVSLLLLLLTSCLSSCRFQINSLVLVSVADPQWQGHIQETVGRIQTIYNAQGLFGGGPGNVRETPLLVQLTDTSQQFIYLVHLENNTGHALALHKHLRQLA